MRKYGRNKMYIHRYQLQEMYLHEMRYITSSSEISKMHFSEITDTITTYTMCAVIKVC